MPLNLRLWSFGTFWAASSHQELIFEGSTSCWISCTSKCSQVKTWVQTDLAKGQSKQRCRPVSSGPLHTMQLSWCGQSLVCMLLSWEFCFVLESEWKLCIYFLHALSKLGLVGISHMILWTESDKSNEWVSSILYIEMFILMLLLR